MVTIIYTKPEEMRLMSLLKKNNRDLKLKEGREEAIKRNNNLLKEYRTDIVKTAKEA